jgi:hypothetical protein
LIQRNPDYKGQVAIEFMVYTTVFMFIAIAAFVVVSELQSTEIPLQQNSVVREIGNSHVTMLILAIKGGEGFSYNYTFQKTVFNLPYKLYLHNLSNAHYMVLEWEGGYGNYSYSYDVPSYNYVLEGSCLTDNVFVSDECSNMFMFYNDGENLTITQVGP